jgi:hypothetical protein
VHHADEDITNNDPTNLETLCVTCHNRHHFAGRTRTELARLAALGNALVPQIPEWIGRRIIDLRARADRMTASLPSISYSDSRFLMRLHRWNGEFWYADDRSTAKRMATWVLWPGGWGTFKTWPMRKRLHPHYWTPVSLLGHRVTFFGWGIQARMCGGCWVMAWDGEGRRLYWSPDGTPSSATVWVYGTPPEVTFAAGEHRREQEQRNRMRAVA